MAEEEQESETCQLYLISPPRIVPAEFIPHLREALETGGVACFQLRLKEASDAEILAAAEQIRPLCDAANIPFILNDRPDLAVQCGADGVHLGQDDMAIKEAREIIGREMVIGVSAHASKHLAMEAAEAGADYVAFGAFFPTTSKSPEKLAKYGTPEVEIIDWWCTYTTVPCVAIGGITPENCGPLAAAGADFVAAITAIWKHPQGAAAAVRAFTDRFKEAVQLSA
jgi:thiamine-phosphate pyrophosphorylase